MDSLEAKNPYTRLWYRRLWREGRAIGSDSKRSRAVCPGAIVPDRAAWLRGFQQGRVDLRQSHGKGC